MKGAVHGRDRFELLLNRIGTPEQYEALRYRLIAYFRWEQCRDHEYLADETIDRLAQRMAAGTDIANWSSYALGIARLVAKEHRASLLREAKLMHELAQQPSHGIYPDIAVPADDPADLNSCLERFTTLQKDQLLRYYVGERGLMGENRRAFADELALTPNALSNRMLRLRKLLIHCMSAKRKERR